MKKIVALTMVMAMVLGLACLSGCGKKEKTASEITAESSITISVDKNYFEITGKSVLDLKADLDEYAKATVNENEDGSASYAMGYVGYEKYRDDYCVSTKKDIVELLSAYDFVTSTDEAGMGEIIMNINVNVDNAKYKAASAKDIKAAANKASDKALAFQYINFEMPEAAVNVHFNDAKTGKEIETLSYPTAE